MAPPASLVSARVGAARRRRQVDGLNEGIALTLDPSKGSKSATSRLCLVPQIRARMAAWREVGASTLRQ
jgi:hypothetical protein